MDFPFMINEIEELLPIYLTIAHKNLEWDYIHFQCLQGFFPLRILTKSLRQETKEWSLCNVLQSRNVKTVIQILIERYHL